LRNRKGDRCLGGMNMVTPAWQFQNNRAIAKSTVLSLWRKYKMLIRFFATGDFRSNA
jgi:hypothetical protein